MTAKPPCKVTMEQKLRTDRIVLKTIAVAENSRAALLLGVLAAQSTGIPAELARAERALAKADAASARKD